MKPAYSRALSRSFLALKKDPFLFVPLALYMFLSQLFLGDYYLSLPQQTPLPFGFYLISFGVLISFFYALLITLQIFHLSTRTHNILSAKGFFLSNLRLFLQLFAYLIILYIPLFLSTTLLSLVVEFGMRLFSSLEFVFQGVLLLFLMIVVQYVVTFIFLLPVFILHELNTFGATLGRLLVFIRRHFVSLLILFSFLMSLFFVMMMILLVCIKIPRIGESLLAPFAQSVGLTFMGIFTWHVVDFLIRDPSEEEQPYTPESLN